jgi:carbamoyl-phosphate synthase large subunit
VNLLLSCIGRRGYLARWFREQLDPGDRIIGTSNSAWTPAFHACDLGVLMPDVASPEYLPALLDLCRREHVDALLSFHDLDVDRIAGARDRFLAAGVLPVVADAAVSRIGLDKLETARYLGTHGIRVPATHPTLDAALAALQAGALRLPVVIKPRRGFASQDIWVADTEQELRVLFPRRPELVVQERLGGDEHSIDILNDLDGRVISVVVKRKLAMRAGETDQAVTIRHQGALELGERLGTLLGHVGPLDVDLFIEGDKLTVLELNPRFGGAYPVSHLAGAEFPRRIVAMLRGQTLAPDIGGYQAGVGMMKGIDILPAWTGQALDLRDGTTT